VTDLYTLLRASLIEHIQDKDFSVWVQAVITLSKLSGLEDPEDLDKDEPEVVDMLIEILQFDLSG